MRKGNTERNIFLLSKLSMTNKENLKLFKETFPIVIENLNNLCCFIYYIKKIRGFGRTIRECIKKWFKSKTTFELESFYENEIYYCCWSFRDILKEFHINPKNKSEEILFKKIMNNFKIEEKETLLYLFNRYEIMKSFDTESLFISNLKLIYELIISKLSILKTNKKIIHIIENSTLFNELATNTKTKMSVIIKNMLLGFLYYTNSSIYDLNGNEVNDLDFTEKSLKKSFIVNFEPKADIVIVWSDKRDIKINTTAKLIKFNLSISRRTYKDEENCYKFLGFNDNTIDTLSSIIKGEI